METLGARKLYSFIDEPNARFRTLNNYMVRSNSGVEVANYPELVQRVAELSFFNPEHVLLFRGQKEDWTNSKGNSSLKPGIFRPFPGKRASPKSDELRGRYEKLARADYLLSKEYPFTGRQRMSRYRILRWAILQHYEVCPTPLLDVTHSLRVAASFATNHTPPAKPILYVLGVPALSGTITASSEQGLQIIRLSSICPPEARRPYFQEGYLLAEYPDLVTLDEKLNYAAWEVDFGRRLLAKFRLARSGFWSAAFPVIPHEALYPDQSDAMTPFARHIKERLT